MRHFPLWSFLLTLSLGWLSCEPSPQKSGSAPAAAPTYVDYGAPLPLWPEGVPDCPIDSPYRVVMDPEIGRRTLAVQTPTIEVFLPAHYRATGQAVLICPGGGYYLQAYDWEGTELAKWLNQQGIAAFVLQYRLPAWTEPPCSEHVAWDDATRAMRLIRHRAKAFRIDPDQLGVMGFSAGGHLASTLSTHFDPGQPIAPDPIERQSSRPAFSVLVYPVISGDSTIYHGGSFEHLLGPAPDSAKVAYFSSDQQVTAQTPPTFLLHAADDASVPVENSLRYFQALQRHGVPAALHVFPTGGHGFALGEDHELLADWVDLLADWLAHLP